MVSKDYTDKELLNGLQINIFNGLKEIGDEIAYLYYDGVKIFNSELRTKSYLLSHIAREIEGGIRDIFASMESQETIKCSECGTVIHLKNHIDEICQILDLNKEDEFVKHWHNIASKFHKYAHRHGPWKSPREKDEFNALWKEFENILNYLVGDYIRVTSLVDKILKSEKPTEEILNTLKNLLHNKARETYFFKKLSSINWFKPLCEMGYFSCKNAPSSYPSDQEGVFVIPQWNVLPYLEKVSQQVNELGNEKYIDELIKIIRDVSNYKDIEGKPIDNYRTWWYFVKILVNIPPEKIPMKIIDLISIWLNSKFNTSLAGVEILDKLLPRFLEDSATKEAIKKAEKIIEYTTKVKRLPKKETSFGGEAGKYKTVIDGYYLIEAFKKYSKTIGEKCSKEVIDELSKKIKDLLKTNKYETPVTIDDKTYLFVLSDNKKDYVVKVSKAEGKTEIDLLGEIFEGEKTSGELVAEIKVKKGDRGSFLENVYTDLVDKLHITFENHSDILRKKLRDLFVNFHSKGTYSSFYEEKKYIEKKPP